MINLYFDAEFTGLHKDTTLISIGIVSASGESFYAEFNDFADYQISPWIKENVLSNTVVKGENKELAELLDKENTVFVIGSKYEVRESLLEWLKHFESGGGLVQHGLVQTVNTIVQSPLFFRPATSSTTFATSAAVFAQFAS